MDSRIAATGRVPANGSLLLKIAGVGELPVQGVATANLRVTALDPTSSGQLKVIEPGSAGTGTSALDYSSGGAFSLERTAALNDDGYVQLLNQAASDVAVTVDVKGWYATTTPPSSSMPNLAVTADGWIAYEDARTQRLGLSGGAVAMVQSDIDPDDGCTIDNNSVDDLFPSANVVVEEVGYHPASCRQRLQVTPYSNEQAGNVARHELSRETGTAGTRTSTFASGEGEEAGYDEGNPQAEAARADASNFPHLTWIKTIWEDPIEIDITWAKETLKWKSVPGTYPENLKSVGKGETYGFSQGPDVTVLDSKRWYNTSTPGQAARSFKAKFHNSTFQAYVYAILGPAGYAACGFTDEVARFKHHLFIQGRPVGDFDSTSKDSKKGACTNLVHHVTVRPNTGGGVGGGGSF